VRKERERLVSAESLPGNEGRNARYQITVECFDRLKGLDFKKRLSKDGISTTVDVKSINPEKPGWNRKLQ
jgi:hypothetical protein